MANLAIDGPSIDASSHLATYGQSVMLIAPAHPFIRNL
jgi:hypothetical protein